MAKTKPIGVRFDEDFLKNMKEKGFGTPQQILNHLTNLAKDTPIGKKILEDIKQTPSIFKVRDITPEGVVQGVYEMTEKSFKKMDPLDIEKQIEAIKAEKMPSHITTSMGKKSWNFDQQKRINELKKTS